MLKEFKEFAMRGNVVDMAVGIIIGAAFTAIVTSLVQDVITPPLAVLQKGAGSFENLVIPLAGSEEGIAIGKFINAVITFLITSFAVFILVRSINKLRPPAVAEVTTRDCPYCLSSVPKAATRCGHCTSELPPA